MLATAARHIRRRLTPERYQRLRTAWWYGRHFVPRLLASTVVRRAPAVRGFPAGRDSALVDRIRSVNLVAPTRLCRVMTAHGSDKGFDRHNYTTVYDALFGENRDRPLVILELGIGTNNPQGASSMGAFGRPAASLRGWREFFPRALIYGADIDRDILVHEDRITTFYCDQLDPESIRALWSQPALQSGADIIIDDGLHSLEANVSFLDGSVSHLRPGGVYVVEDIHRNAIPLWRRELETKYVARCADHEFALVELPNAVNQDDNNLLIARRLV
jgi:prepilin-type processing-associated H-X9-DG protein